MTDTPVKLCKDCKHSGYRSYQDVCLRSQRKKVDLVDGHVRFVGPRPRCKSQRHTILPWRCGPSGKYWEGR